MMKTFLCFLCFAFPSISFGQLFELRIKHTCVSEDVDILVKEAIDVTARGGFHYEMSEEVLGQRVRDFTIRDVAGKGDVATEVFQHLLTMSKQHEGSSANERNGAGSSLQGIIKSWDGNKWSIIPIGSLAPGEIADLKELISLIRSSVVLYDKERQTHSEGDFEDPEEVRLRDLKERPQQYEGKRVKVKGFLFSSNDTVGLAENPPDNNFKPLLWIGRPSSKITTALSMERYLNKEGVVIEGVFFADSVGLDGYFGSLRRVTGLTMESAERADKGVDPALSH